ncbi:DUF4348 domain-containing protein [Flavobacterium alkalisoli]|uniref:DUF4348 domain-containing protein n=1 Tax=Flavobacterium alkalisoli TaxID=2602769 RepID=UPI003A9536E9
MRFLLLIILVVAVGCNKEVKTVKEDSTNTIAVETLPSSKEDCDENFDAFFIRFQNDSVFQKNHVKFPLKNTFLDNDYVNVIREDILRDKYRFNDFENDKTAEDYTVNLKQEKNNDTVYYSYRGIDNGIFIDIKFLQINGCWYLVAIEDSST